MNKGLLIAEKPSQMRQIKEVYDRLKPNLDIDFLHQRGHLIGLKTPKEIDGQKYGKWKLENIPEVFPYEYKIISDTKDLYNNIKDAIKSGKYDYIIHAGDPDGEGELLINETLNLIGNILPVKRFWTNDLSDRAILDAFNNMKDDKEYCHILEASQIRQHVDFQVGMNVTTAASLKLGTLCKLGRVKAAIVAIIVARELEIENYVEKKTYKPTFTYKSAEFVFDRAFDTPTEATNVFPDTDVAHIVDADSKIKQMKPPKLFKLSTLQSAAYTAFKWSGSKTLSVLQTLYEGKAVTYPRTDCEYISTEIELAKIKNTVAGVIPNIDNSLLIRSENDIKNDKGYCNDNLIAKEGHTAIIPTAEGLFAGATDDQIKLYTLIGRRFLSIFAEPKKIRSVKVIAYPAGTEDKYVFTETIDVNPSFEYILNPDYKKREGCGISFASGEDISPIEFKVKECVTKPPKRYNDGSLIEALDKPEAFEGDDGKVKFKIGTPATRSNIIEECQENEYFFKKSGLFYATDKAKIVVSTFKDVPIFDFKETGRMEEMFDKVRHGEISAAIVEEKMIKEMITSVNGMKDVVVTTKMSNAPAIGKCPKCRADVSYGKYGAFCVGKCGMGFKVLGKMPTEKEIKALLAGKKTLVSDLKSKKGSIYSAYIIPKGINSFDYEGKTMYGLAFDMEFPQKKKG